MGAFPCHNIILTFLILYCNIVSSYLRTKVYQMLTNKQKILLMLAFMIFSVSLLGMVVIPKLALDTGSRATINVAYILTVLGSSTGLLIAALIAIRAFRKQPLAPEFPLWMKLCSYYATCMIAAGVLNFVLTGDNWQDRMYRQKFEQMSNVTAINVAMIILGLAYFGCLWLIDRRSTKDDNSLKT